MKRLVALPVYLTTRCLVSKNSWRPLKRSCSELCCSPELEIVKTVERRGASFGFGDPGPWGTPVPGPLSTGSPQLARRSVWAVLFGL